LTIIRCISHLVFRKHKIGTLHNIGPVNRMSMIDTVLTAWRRRYWRGDGESLQRFSGLKPFTIITGASEGIGRAFALACGARGDNLVLIARGVERLDTVAIDVRARVQSVVVVLPLDVTALDAAQRIEAAVAAQAGYVNLLINNAGFGLGGAFQDYASEQIDTMVQLNVAAPTRLMRAFLPDMIARGAGGIINVSSLGGYGPGPWQAAYYASKAYVTSLSEAVAYETRGQGVRILAVAPGPVETAFHAKMGSDHALYRWMIPSMSAESVARSGLRAYRLGRRVVLPGLLSPLLMAVMRVTPHAIGSPFLSVLLHVEKRNSGAQGSNKGDA
jgi:uncharacterized protein